MLVHVALVQQQPEVEAVGAARHVDRLELARLELGALVAVEREVPEPRELDPLEARRRRLRLPFGKRPDKKLDPRRNLELVREQLDLPFQ